MRNFPKFFGHLLPIATRPLVPVRRCFFAQNLEELMQKASRSGQEYFLFIKNQLKDELDSGSELEPKRLRQLLKNFSDLSQVDSFVQFDLDSIQQHGRVVRQLSKINVSAAQDLAVDFYTHLKPDRLTPEMVQEIANIFLEFNANQLGPLSQSGLKFVVDFLYSHPSSFLGISNTHKLENLVLQNFDANFQNMSLAQRLKIFLIFKESQNQKANDLTKKIQTDIRKNLAEIDEENLSFLLRALDQGLLLEDKEKVFLEEIFEKLIKSSCEVDLIWSTLSRVFTDRLINEFTPVLINTLPMVENDRKIELYRILVGLKIENSEMGGMVRTSLDLEVNKLSQIDKWVLLMVLAQSQKELAHTSLGELFEEVTSDPFGNEISRPEWMYAASLIPEGSKLTAEQVGTLRKKAGKYLKK